MKFFNVLICCITLFYANVNFAQSAKTNILKLGGSIFTITEEGESESLFGGSLALEHQLKSKSSLLLALEYNAKSESLSDGGLEFETKLSILTFEPEYRWYSKAATDGFFLGIAPSIHIIGAKIKLGTSEVSDDETRFGAGVKTGYQIKLTPKLNLQFLAGGGLILPGGDTDAVWKFNFNLLAGYQF